MRRSDAGDEVRDRVDDVARAERKLLDVLRAGRPGEHQERLEAGLHTILVLTGLTSRHDAERHPYRASRIVDSVADLLDGLR